MEMQSQLNEERSFDVAILGGGTGGYVAAIRAAQLGLSVVVVEEDKVGGTCLHRGCIPSKALLRSAEVFREVAQAAEFGVVTSEPTLNWSRTLERKGKLVQTLFAGVQGLLKKNRVELVNGRGLVVQYNGGLAIRVHERIIPARKVIVATGSRPISMGLALDDKTIMTSDQALLRETLPSSVIIAGGGTIGMEWASIYRDCGVKVTVVEALPRILAAEDIDISKEMHKRFERQGVRFMTSTKVDFKAVNQTDNGVKVPLSDESGQVQILEAEALLIAIGRRACVENIGLEALRLSSDAPYLKVNGYQQLTYPGIYAIGDICGGGLAHVAALQGTIAVEHIAGLSPKRYEPLIIPKCTYTYPEIASIGLSEQAAKDQGMDVDVGRFPFRAIAKSLIIGDHEGFAKVITQKGSGKVVGVHVLGPHATELIAEGGLILANDMNLSQWAKMVHPHPSVSEIFHEAVLTVENRAIHN